MKTRQFLKFVLCSSVLALGACGDNPTPQSQPQSAAGPPVDAVRFDTIIRGGTVYDGSGQPGVVADVAINGDRIVVIGDLTGAVGGKNAAWLKHSLD